MKHDLIPQDKGFMCSVCGQTYKQAPGDTCPGVKVYQWKPWPAHLMTKAQLDKAGYQTGQNLPKPAGVIFRAKSPGGKMWLYDPNEAVKKAPVSEKQAFALAKAQAASAARWICKESGGYLHYKETRSGLCNDCEIKLQWQTDKARVIEWARKWLRNKRAIILDCETTGLDGGWNEAIEIAVIDLQGQTLIDTLIQPLYPERMSRRAAEIHGITAEMLLEAPSFPRVYNMLRPVLKRSHVLIYNAEFDHSMLRGQSKMHSMPRLKALGWHDLMIPWSTFVGQIKHHWDGRRRRYNGWDYRWQALGGNHRALGDCLEALSVLRTMAD